MIVNLFLSTDVWTKPLNEFGVKQHVYALYEKVFHGCDQLNIYPKRATGNLLSNVLQHLPALFSGKLNVLSPGYPVVIGAIVSWFRRDSGFIVHTWKVPGLSDNRLSARIHDILLRRVNSCARAIVVASMTQKRQLEEMGVSCPVVFAPVSVDSRFWYPDPEGMDDVLSKFRLKSNSYILTVGGSDRDEIYAANMAKVLGLSYVRATYSPHWAEYAKIQLEQMGLQHHSHILIRPTDVELRALYAGAYLLCLPTLTRTNPAGLTSMVEGMSCGAIVAVPEKIAEGYVHDGCTGFVLKGSPDEFAMTFSAYGNKLPSIKKNARYFAESKLNNINIAKKVRYQFEVANVFNRST